jgi:hypothetical protein
MVQGMKAQRLELVQGRVQKVESQTRASQGDDAQGKIALNRSLSQVEDLTEFRTSDAQSDKRLVISIRV